MKKYLIRCQPALFYLFIASPLIMIIAASGSHAAAGILFVGDDGLEKNIYLADPETGAEKIITEKPKDVKRFINLDIAVSPDGKYAAYASRRVYPDENLEMWGVGPGKWNGKPLFPMDFYIYGYSYFNSRVWRRSLRSYNWNIQVYEFDTGKTRQYTAWKWDEAQPQFMRRGSDVLYSLTAEKSVFIIQGRRTGKFRQITVRDNEAINPRLSPDGKFIVFQSFLDGNWELYDLRLAEKLKDKIKTRLTRTTHVSEILPQWSPDGNSILFLANYDGRKTYDLYLLDRKSLAVTRLTNGERCTGEAAFSPDGKRIAFVGDKTNRAEIYLLDVPTKTLKAFAAAAGKSHYPAWSPDGARIAFISDRDGMPGLYVAGVETNKVKKVTKRLAFWNPPVWF